MPWNVVVRWCTGTNCLWLSLNQAAEAALRTTGWRRRSRFRSLQPPSQACCTAFLLFSAGLSSPSLGETEHIWSCSHEAKHGASPAPSQHHKRAHTHKHPHMCVPQWDGTEEFVSHSSFVQTGPQHWTYIFINAGRSFYSGKELFYLKKILPTEVPFKSFLN